MIFQEKMYGAICDNCQETFEDYHSGFSMYADESCVNEALDNNGWHNNHADFDEDTKHYCDKCFTIDDEDVLHINSERTKVASLPSAAPQPATQSVEGMAGIKLVMEERKRQIEVEKFDYDHDEDYKNGELIGAAGCYVANALSKLREENSATNQKPLARFQFYDFGELDFLVNSGDRGDRRVRKAGWIDGWPWDAQWDKRKKHDKQRSLVIAAALIIAHLDQELKSLSTLTHADQKGEGWIRCEDGLPEVNMDVLVYAERQIDAYSKVFVGWLSFGKQWASMMIDDDEPLNPTHWQPLPSPPSQPGEQC